MKMALRTPLIRKNRRLRRSAQLLATGLFAASLLDSCDTTFLPCANTGGSGILISQGEDEKPLQVCPDEAWLTVEHFAEEYAQAFAVLPEATLDPLGLLGAPSEIERNIELLTRAFNQSGAGAVVSTCPDETDFFDSGEDRDPTYIGYFFYCALPLTDPSYLSGASRDEAYAPSDTEQLFNLLHPSLHNLDALDPITAVWQSCHQHYTQCTYMPDIDGDGSPLGTDCDDRDAMRFPDAVEICNGLDENCDGAVPTTEIDTDGDGLSVCADDCNDTSVEIYPGAAEVCDGLDNNCNDQTDEDLGAIPDAVILGECANNTQYCAGTQGYQPSLDNYFPQEEICDGLDNNCNDQTDEDLGAIPDAVILGECANNTQYCAGTQGYQPSLDNYVPQGEDCNGLDDDCNGSVPSNEDDLDFDGERVCAGDCNDLEALVNSSMLESCNGVNDNCANGVDEGMVPVPSVNTQGLCADNWDLCTGPGGYQGASSNWIPTPEVCNGLDDNCNGQSDEGLGLIADVNILGECSNNTQYCAGTSGYLASASNYIPTTEICNGLDDNCTGEVDEELPEIPLNLLGECANNFEYCAGTLGYQPSPTNFIPTTEQCNLLDDDCDGIVPANEPDADGDGQAACDGDCDDNDASRSSLYVEICDGIDNDCDTVVDNGMTPLPAANILGLCADNTQICDGFSGYVADPSNYIPTSEICDGFDNDCNNAVDDNLDLLPAANTLGLCVGNVQYCDATTLGQYVDSLSNYVPLASELCNGLDDTCVGSLSSDELDQDGDTQMPCAGDCDDLEELVNTLSVEVCDTLDNDCTGIVDDNLPLAPAPNTYGLCAANTQYCDETTNGAYVDSLDNYLPTDEICNALDDDCNDVVDDGLADIPTSNTLGLCMNNVQYCDPTLGQYVDSPTNYTPVTEICDALDNDCNDAVDDNLPLIPAPNTLGLCVANTQYCDATTNGSYADSADNYIPTSEICDNLDNDCDGTDPALENSDTDGDGQTVCTGDCDDSDPLIYQNSGGLLGATDFCTTGFDEDCDGTADNNCCPAGLSSLYGGELVAIPSLEMCIGRFEAHINNSTGQPVHDPTLLPTTDMSQIAYAAACATRGWVLPSETLLFEACRGPDQLFYPYGNIFQAGTCDDAQPQDLATSFLGCVSPYGVYGLSGGVWELDSDCVSGDCDAHGGGYGPFTSASPEQFFCTSARTHGNISDNGNPAFASSYHGFRCATDMENVDP